MLKRAWIARSLVSALIRRQYHLRYRQSVAGLAWALVPPLATLGAATLVFHRVAGLDTGETPYAIVTLAALAPWTFFANSLTFGIPSVAEAQLMVTRLAFPRVALPLAAVGVSLIDLGISAVLFVVFAYAIGHGLPLTAVWFPVVLLVETLLIVGVVLLGSALNVFARDVKLAVPVLVQLWLFLTPVMYPLDLVPRALRSWYLVNPMTGVVEAARGILVYGEPDRLALLLPPVIGAVTILVLGVWYFGATESRFADVV